MSGVKVVTPWPDINPFNWSIAGFFTFFFTVFNSLFLSPLKLPPEGQGVWFCIETGGSSQKNLYKIHKWGGGGNPLQNQGTWPDLFGSFFKLLSKKSGLQNHNLEICKSSCFQTFSSISVFLVKKNRCSIGGDFVEGWFCRGWVCESFFLRGHFSGSCLSFCTSNHVIHVQPLCNVQFTHVVCKYICCTCTSQVPTSKHRPSCYPLRVGCPDFVVKPRGSMCGSNMWNEKTKTQ